MPWIPDPLAEWLETDGRGGYATGTVSGRRTRRYHGHFVAAAQPPTQRVMLVNGFDAWLEIGDDSVPISTQLYSPFVVSPDNTQSLDEFSTVPWPMWTFRLPDGRRIRQELLMLRGRPATILRWRYLDDRRAAMRLHVRPFLSGRDHHGIHRENAVVDLKPHVTTGCWNWKLYPGIPELTACSNGFFKEHPLWYRQFLYELERERGLEDLEDLASPGVWTWNLATTDAVLIWTTDASLLRRGDEVASPPIEIAQQWIATEAARRQRRSAVERLADTYCVSGANRTTFIAGYPWFTDWGRDTFIALRGFCLATGDFASAGKILSAWSEHVSEGMLPNRFPDAGLEPEFNSVDASLWYVWVVHEFLTETATAGWQVPGAMRHQLLTAVGKILNGYAEGTRYQIHRDHDGLISAGVSGVQLTWMDAKVGEQVITPRIGKPVEIQALWLNALAAFPELLPDAERWRQRGEAAFVEKFWNAETECLYDVIDVDHRPGATDGSIRPNQLWAIGGLERMLIPQQLARQALQVIENQLLTPIGLRTLSPSDAEYRGRYQGGVRERDGAYHQGTVWPWLLGAFVECWLKNCPDPAAAREIARSRFLDEINHHRKGAGLGHISEIADGDAPHTPRGCPFQAWSVSEWIRLDQRVLG